MIKNKLHSGGDKERFHTLRFYAPDVLEKTPMDAGLLAELKKAAVATESAFVEAGENTIYIMYSDVKKTAARLKKIGFDMLVDLSAQEVETGAVESGAVDSSAESCVELYYIFVRLSEDGTGERLKVKTRLDARLEVESVSEIFSMADWAEREIYDMFGVAFSGHADLRRILMPEDWAGHPLRKSYPLKGDEAAAWYEVDKIFGRESRDFAKREQRESAWVSEEDVANFVKIRAEEKRYQESKKPWFIKAFKHIKTLTKRK